MRIDINVPVGFYEIGARAKQEDAIYPQLGRLSTSSRVFVVCDGLGGHDFGEVASNTVAGALAQWVHQNVSDEWPMNEGKVLAAVAHAQQCLNEAARQHPSDKPMGTTVAMLVLGNNGVVAAHIGDSRIYHVRPSKGAILYRSRDHSLVNDLFAKGRLTREETEASPKKNILTRALIAAPMQGSQPDVALITDVAPGDYFLLCSDGVGGEVTDEKLLEVLQRSDTSDLMKLAALQMLVKDGADNRSALLIRVDRVTHEEDEKLLVANEAAMCDKIVPMSLRLPLTEQEMALEPEGVVDDDSHLAEVPPVPQAAAVAAEPPVVPTEPAKSQDEIGYVTGNEEVHYDYNKPKKTSRSNTWKRAGLILLLALLLAGGIMAYFHNKKPSVETAPKPAIDSVAADPDVSVDSMLPPMPGDSLAVGTDVAVPRAPGIGDVPLPNTDNKPSASSGSYPTGSNVKVQRAPRYDGNGAPPYDPYKGMENFGSDVPIHDDDPAPAPDVSERRSTASKDEPVAPPASRSNSNLPPPPPKKQASNDPASSNRNIAVPMPSGRSSNRPIETP